MKGKGTVAGVGGRTSTHHTFKHRNMGESMRGASLLQEVCSALEGQDEDLGVPMLTSWNESVLGEFNFDDGDDDDESQMPPLPPSPPPKDYEMLPSPLEWKKRLSNNGLVANLPAKASQGSGQTVEEAATREDCHGNGHVQQKDVKTRCRLWCLNVSRGRKKTQKEGGLFGLFSHQGLKTSKKEARLERLKRSIRVVRCVGCGCEGCEGCEFGCLFTMEEM